MSQVILENAVKRYGRVEVLHGLDLEIPEKKLTVLLGPSGCGKSTLLRMIAGLEDITDGDLLIDGEVVNDIDPSRRGCAMVFQSYALYPHQTVYKNMAFPLKMQGMPRTEIDERVHEIAGILELEALLDRLPRDLSGGQRQRVAMGRAMIRQPKVFLFDEPLSNLDAELRVKMRLEIARLQKELGATMIFVTHDQIEAMTLADQIVVMNKGLIQQVGAPLEIYDRPANRFVAGFIGSPSMNFLDVEAAEQAGAGSRITLKGGTVLSLGRPVPERTAVIGVRPEHVRLEGAAIAMAPDDTAVLGVEHLGDRAYLYLSTPFGELTVLRRESEVLLNEHPTGVSFTEDRLQFFDAEGVNLALGTMP